MHFIFSLAGLAIVNLGLTLAMQCWVLIFLGPGGATDAYFAAQAVTFIFLSVLNDILLRVLVPLLAGLTNSDLASAVKGFVLGMIVLFGGLTVLMYCTAKFWMPRLFPGLSGATLDMSIDLVKVLALALLFGALTTLFKAVNHAQQLFIRPEVVLLISNLMVLAGVINYLPEFGVIIVAWGIVLRWFLQAVLLFKWKAMLAETNFELGIYKLAWSRIRPLVLGGTIYKTAPLVDRYLASFAALGSITLLAFGTQLYGIFLQISDKVFAAPLTAVAAKNINAGDWQQLWHNYRQRMLISGGVAALVYVLFICFGKWGLGLLVGYGRFGVDDIQKLWMLMIVLGGMLVVGAVGQLSSSCLYALGKTAFIARVSLINFIIVVILKVFAFKLFGLPGIAAGIVLALVLNTLVFHLMVMHKLKREMLS